MQTASDFAFLPVSCSHSRSSSAYRGRKDRHGGNRQLAEPQILSMCSAALEYSIEHPRKDGAEEKDFRVKACTTCSLSVSSSSSRSLSTPSPKSAKPPFSPDAIASFRPSSPWRRQRLAELVLEHILQVSDVELRGKDASSSTGGCPGGGVLG